jgi:sterol desaturase/sphingolipid hydroxylase (fatty acid hydroxylase superfamily)
MIEGKERWAALDASAEIVRARWWRTIGALLVIALIVLGPTALAATSAVAPRLVEAAVTSAAGALVLPFFIAAQTLLYYDLKARNSVDLSPARIDAP